MLANFHPYYLQHHKWLYSHIFHIRSQPGATNHAKGRYRNHLQQQILKYRIAKLLDFNSFLKLQVLSWEALTHSSPSICWYEHMPPKFNLLEQIGFIYVSNKQPYSTPQSPSSLFHPPWEHKYYLKLLWNCPWCIIRTIPQNNYTIWPLLQMTVFKKKNVQQFILSVILSI